MTKAPRPRLLLVHNQRTSFVAIDHECLAEEFDVTELTMSRAKLNPFALSKQVREHDVIFGWFASWHTFPLVSLAKLYRKPSVLIIGGYDLANLPQIGYGHQRGGFRKILSRATIGQATRLVTNAEFSRREARDNASLDPATVHVVYHGVPDPIGELPVKPNEDILLTVGNVDRANLWRKGHEPFVRAAAELPEARFHLVGGFRDKAIDHLRSLATPNVAFAGRVSDEELLRAYRDAKVYLQLSAHEGFGMSLAEAMLAGCIPVVTKAGAMPEVVGDTGLYVEDTEPATVAAAVREALALPDEARRRARQRILDEFPVQRRSEGLRAHVRAVLGQRTA